MPEPSRRLRLFLRCLAALLLGILLLAGAAMVYVQHNSVAITHALLEDFTQRTGLHLHVRSIGLSWLPPAVQADDVRIRIKELDISVRTARLRPRLTALLQGRLELEYVALQNPVLSGSLPLPTLDLRKLGSAAGGGSGDTGGLARLDGLLPGTLQIEIDQGNFSFQAQDASSLRAGNLSCVLHLRGLQDVRGKLQAGLIRNLAAGEEIPVLDLENLLVEGRSRPLRFLSDTPRLRLRTLLHLPPHLPRVRMNLDFTATAAGWQLDHDIQGDLMQDDEPIPFAVAACCRTGTRRRPRYGACCARFSCPIRRSWPQPERKVPQRLLPRPPPNHRPLMPPLQRPLPHPRWPPSPTCLLREGRARPCVWNASGWNWAKTAPPSTAT